ncbi:MAG: SusC/RagA family TonB-linked outer membrane protein [Marinifilaceae bacterium]
MRKGCLANFNWLKRVALLSVLFLAFGLQSFSQNRVVTGTVTSADDGYGIPGASVFVKGTTAGTSTDIDGNYKVTVPAEGKVLVFSFVGMTTQEVEITSEVINVVLQTDSKQMEEVVVTALGIKRAEKSLGYSVSEVKGEELTMVRQNNPVQSLSGKVSGVNIGSTAGGVNSSTRIVIRGNSSIAGSNQPLVVIDGVPMDNSSRDGAGKWGGYDYGDGLSDLNPDDIESMSVLKGANASALYGSRAANGVILVTTKTGKGQKKGIGVSINSNVTFDQVARLPEMQNVYGQGTQGTLGSGADGKPVISGQNTGSWGPKMEGQQVHNWDREGNLIDYSPQANNVEDFYRTGITMSNNVTFTSNTEKGTALVSMTDQRVRDIMPNSNMNKQNINMRLTTDLTDKFHVDAKFTYLKQKVENRPALGDNRSNAAGTLLTMPRSIQLSDISNYKYATSFNPDYKDNNADGRPRIWDSEEMYITNPYWVLNEEHNEDEKEKVNGFISLSYDITPHLKAMVRSGIDSYNLERYAYRAPNNRLILEGDMEQSVDRNTEWTSDFMFTYNNTWGDWNLNATVGGSYNERKFERVGNYGKGFKAPGMYVIGNVEFIDSRYGLEERATSSLYGTAGVGYKNYLYLDVTARNDWSSTLPEENWSFFYPSVTGSFIFTEAFDFFKENTNIFSFGKLRAGWAEVGKDASPYMLADVYNLNTWSVDGNPTAGLNETKALSTLKPENTESYEFGLDLRFLNNRVGLDVTYYNADTYDQILASEIAVTSGYKRQVINAGQINNHGLEVMLRGAVIEKKDISWDLAFTYAKNTNEVVELKEGVEAQVLGEARSMGVRVEARPEEAYGQIIGYGYKRNDQGQILVDDGGLPIRAEEESVLGNFNPDWTGGLTSSFRYKNWRLNATLDMKYGGELFAYSLYAMDGAGTSKASLKGREEWYNGKGGYLVNGVNENTGAANAVYLNPEVYYGELGSRNIAEPYIVDASYIKLSEVSLGYSVPKSFVSKYGLGSVDLNFVARNLGYLWKATDNIYPDATYNNGNAQGIEHLALPETVGYGFNVRVKF